VLKSAVKVHLFFLSIQFVVKVVILLITSRQMKVMYRIVCVLLQNNRTASPLLLSIHISLFRQFRRLRPFLPHLQFLTVFAMLWAIKPASTRSWLELSSSNMHSRNDGPASQHWNRGKKTDYDAEYWKTLAIFTAIERI
jgi:hypothetical protein